MGGVNTALIALASLFALAGVGWFTLHAVRMGFDYMSARGNPRNRAGAHESGRDLLVGGLIVIGAIAGSALFYATMAPAAAG
jgi:hypothetical protein